MSALLCADSDKTGDTWEGGFSNPPFPHIVRARSLSIRAPQDQQVMLWINSHPLRLLAHFQGMRERERRAGGNIGGGPPQVHLQFFKCIGIGGQHREVDDGVVK